MKTKFAQIVFMVSLFAICGCVGKVKVLDSVVYDAGARAIAEEVMDLNNQLTEGGDVF